MPLLMNTATKLPMSEPIPDAAGRAVTCGEARADVATGAFPAEPINELGCETTGSTTKLLRAGSAPPTLVSSIRLLVVGWPNSRRTNANAAHMNGSCIGVAGSVPVACGPRPSDERSPAISAVTTFGRGAAVASDVVSGSTDRSADAAGTDSAAVDTVDGVPCTGGAADGLGADTPLPPGVEADDVAAATAVELTVGGCAVLVVVAPVASPL